MLTLIFFYLLAICHYKSNLIKSQILNTSQLSSRDGAVSVEIPNYSGDTDATIANNQWEITPGNKGQHWAVHIKIGSETNVGEWGFHPSEKSFIRITMDSDMDVDATVDQDAVMAFSVGGNNYVSTFFALDSQSGMSFNSRIAPQCDTLANPALTSVHLHANAETCVENKAGAGTNCDADDCYWDSAINCTDNKRRYERVGIEFSADVTWQPPQSRTEFPITFEIENNPGSPGTSFTRLQSTTGNGATDYEQECGFAEAFPSSLGLDVWINADANTETINFKSFTVEYETHTASPTEVPTATPSESPTPPSDAPTTNPTKTPTKGPTYAPTKDPTADPTNDPTADPTSNPTDIPTVSPTNKPTAGPTDDPTKDPTTDPTHDPTKDPTSDPTEDPTKDPSIDPTHDPTTEPTNDPTDSPSMAPTVSPSYAPTPKPSDRPTVKPVKGNPTEEPITAYPSVSPVVAPTYPDNGFGDEEKQTLAIYIGIGVGGAGMVMLFICLIQVWIERRGEAESNVRFRRLPLELDLDQDGRVDNDLNTAGFQILPQSDEDVSDGKEEEEEDDDAMKEWEQEVQRDVEESRQQRLLGVNDRSDSNIDNL